jgi:anti-sigma B factor antagonist
MTTASRHLQIEPIGDVSVVRFTDKKLIDDQTIRLIGDQLCSLVDEQGQRKILLNFGNVEYLSSAALGRFIILHKKVIAAGGRLVLYNIDSQIYEVFAVTKLNKLFDIRRRGDDDDPEAELGGVRSS